MSEERKTNDRRKPTERRASGDRRRGAEGRHVVLHLGRTHLHMGMVIRNARGEPELLHTKSINWRGEQEPLPNAVAAEQFAASLKELVAKERAVGCSASLVLNGDLCVSRVTKGPSVEVNRSLDDLDDRSQLYLSLGPGAKTSATSRLNIDARHEMAVVSVAGEQTVRRLVDAASSAGLELQSIEAETIALARAHAALQPEDDEPVLLVQFDGEEFEIAISHKGNLWLDYRPGGNVKGACISDVLAQHHSRLQRFCQRWLGDFNMELKKVYLAGDTSTVRKAVKSLAGSGEYDARVMDTKLASDLWQKAPEGLDSSHVVLMGRVLREIDAAPETPAPNLMGRWIAESRKHVRPILLRAAAPIAAVLLLALGLAFANYRVQARVATLEVQVAELMPAELEHKQIMLGLIASEDKLKRLGRLSEGITKPNLTGVLTTVGGCLPDDVWLDRMQVHDLAKIQVSGASYSESGVYDFVRHLELAPALQQVALEGTGVQHTREGPATSFDLNGKLMPAENAPKQESP